MRVGGVNVTSTMSCSSVTATRTTSFSSSRARSRRVSYTTDGDKISFARIEAGDFFGELSAIDGETRSASVIAIEDSLVARMSANRFNQLILVHPELATHLLRRLIQMIRTTNNRIVELSSEQGG